MVAYEFYANNGSKEAELLGILPERRKTSGRITPEAIMKWGRLVVMNSPCPKKIFFIKVIIDDDTGRVVKSDYLPRKVSSATLGTCLLDCANRC